MDPWATLSRRKLPAPMSSKQHTAVPRKCNFLMPSDEAYSSLNSFMLIFDEQQLHLQRPVKLSQLGRRNFRKDNIVKYLHAHAYLPHVAATSNARLHLLQLNQLRLHALIQLHCTNCLHQRITHWLSVACYIRSLVTRNEQSVPA
jgi:hypothetical protein